MKLTQLELILTHSSMENALSQVELFSIIYFKSVRIEVLQIDQLKVINENCLLFNTKFHLKNVTKQEEAVQTVVLKVMRMKDFGEEKKNQQMHKIVRMTFRLICCICAYLFSPDDGSSCIVSILNVC